MSEAPVKIPFDISGLVSAADASGELSAYYEALMTENQAVNLVSRETDRAGFDHMAAECLLPLASLPGTVPVQRYLDIGSGGGFPVVPLMQAGIAASAVAAERTGKKARALERIVSSLDLPISVISQTVEEMPSGAPFDLVSLRYVRLTTRLLTFIDRLLAPRGVLVYYASAALPLKGWEIVEYSFDDIFSGAEKHFSILQKK